VWKSKRRNSKTLGSVYIEPARERPELRELRAKRARARKGDSSEKWLFGKVALRKSGSLKKREAPFSCGQSLRANRRNNAKRCVFLRAKPAEKEAQQCESLRFN
jgi:hypothetical protein